MRRSLLVLAVALVAILAACTSSSGPGWTYAPPTEPPASQPAASGDASAPPSGEAPSGEAPSGETPSGGGGDDVVLDLVASGIQWQQKELSAPADTAFVIRLDNQDTGVPHNVEIKDAAGMTLYRGETFPGVAVKDYPIDPLPAGTYQFICTVHPNMVGTLTIGG